MSETAAANPSPSDSPRPTLAEAAPAEPEVGRHWSDWVSLITAVLAVITAFASAESSNLTAQVLLLQTKESDEWAYYQAKSIKAHAYQLQADALEVMEPASTPALAEKRAALRKRYLEDATKYDEEKRQIDNQAKDLKQQREHTDVRGTRDGRAVIALQIAIVLASVAGITKRRWLLGIGLACGMFGVAYFAAAAWM